MTPPRVDADVLRIGRTVLATTAEGPGLRAALWVQGCAIRCPGCFNPHLWTARGGLVVDAVDWTAEFLGTAEDAGVEGITLLGGEPFEQAAPLAFLANSARDRGLSVMTFTGYDYADLLAWSADRDDIGNLLTATDLLADGPFLADRIDTVRPWIGSTNQSLRPLTSRYRELFDGPDRVEITVDASGSLAVNGWADVDALDLLLADFRRA